MARQGYDNPRRSGSSIRYPNARRDWENQSEGRDNTPIKNPNWRDSSARNDESSTRYPNWRAQTPRGPEPPPRGQAVDGGYSSRFPREEEESDNGYSWGSRREDRLDGGHARRSPREEEEEEDGLFGFGTAKLGALRKLEAPRVLADKLPEGWSTFGMLPLPDKTIEQLRVAMGVVNPLPIQQSAMYEVYNGSNCLIHSPTGSGKTLTFVLPIVARLAAETTPSWPLRCLMLVPSRELAIQLLEVCASLLGNHSATMLVGGSERPEEQLSFLHRTQASILIATPDRLVKVLELESASSRNGGLRTPGALEAERRLSKALQLVVVDEVDRMLEPLGRYATHRDREQRMRHPKPTALLLHRLVKGAHALNRPLQVFDHVLCGCVCVCVCVCARARACVCMYIGAPPRIHHALNRPLWVIDHMWLVLCE